MTEDDVSCTAVSPDRQFSTMTGKMLTVSLRQDLDKLSFLMILFRFEKMPFSCRMFGRCAACVKTGPENIFLQ